MSDNYSTVILHIRAAESTLSRMLLHGERLSDHEQKHIDAELSGLQRMIQDMSDVEQEGTP